MKNPLFVLITFFILSISSSAQNLDSLLVATKKIKDDSTKISQLNRIAFYAIFNDTEKAIEAINEAKKLANSTKDSYALAIINNTHGVYMDVTGKSDSAKYFFTNALKISKTNNFTDVRSNAINNLGMYHWNKGEFNNALNYFFESLKIDEEAENKKSMASSLNNIGLIYQELNLNNKAIEYHKRALEIRKEFSLIKDQVASLNNLGICYRGLGEVDKAIEVYKEGISLAKEINNLLDYYRLLDNLGNAYQSKGVYTKAIETYLKVLDKPKNFKIDEKSNMITYSNLVALYNEMNQPQKAIEYSRKAFDILKANPDMEYYTENLYLYTSETNYMLNNVTKAREQIQKFVKLKDSLFSKENAKAIADLEVKYDTEKKEKQILVQRANLAEQHLVIQKRNYQLYGLAAFALILGLLGYLFYSQQKLKNKQLQKENELKDALIKIETQNKLQEQRLRISRDLHDNIGAQLTFIISSLDNLKYAFKIEDEELNLKLKTISEFTSGTIYELRDTIWAMNKDNIRFEDLKSRITNFINKARETSSSINFDFNIAESVDQTREFSSIEGINIHRVIQEAINNSLKHANASKISIDINKKASSIQIVITDNGIGFDLATIERGNGLSNIEKRVKLLNGDLSINSDTNKGTAVKITI